MAVSAHPSAETLAAFARGDLPPQELSALADHIGACDACCSVLRDIPDDTFANLARAAGPPLAGSSASSSISSPEQDGPTPQIADRIPAELASHPRYRIMKELGAGGMGVVYKAHDQVMERNVAIKVMASHLTSKPGAAERFNKEVRAAAQLEHQNIVRAYDKGEAGNLHFLVMEFLEGESLDKYVGRKGPLAIHLACSFTRQAANGLQHAADRGLTHRDIKPHNLMVLRKGQIKVMDFGLARFVRNDVEEPVLPAGRVPFGAAKPVTDPLTNPHLIMGTPDYLSPEQARNSHNVDHRADIYSLGCTLYFLLTGRPPFAHFATLIDKLLGHTQGKVPSIRKIRPEVPDGLVAVIKKMLAKKPDERYQSAADVAAALSPFTKPDASNPEIVDALMVLPAGASPPPRPSPLPADNRPVQPRPVVVPEADTAPVPDELTLIEEERPRRSRRSRRGRDLPWWQQTWTMIAAAAVGVIVIVAIAVAALGKKDRDGSSDGNSASRGGSPIGGGATPRGGENPNGQVNGEIRPVLYVVPSRGVWKNDYLPVKKRLEDRGVKVVTASGDGGAALVHDGNGETIKVDKRLDEVKASDYSGIVFGGFRIDEYIAGGPHSAQAGRLIDNFREQKKPVSAICIGLGVLVSHDVLKGKQAARSFALKEHYPRLEGGVAWVSEDVVTAHDGPEGSSKLITAAGPEHASSFATALLKALGER